MAVREVSVVRLDEKKSKFYAHLYEIDTPDDVMEVRAIHDKLYKKAAHHCYAVVCGNFTDSRADGEVGSPGRALAEVMERHNLGSHVLMVSRIFGGIKLGPAGVARAFREAGNGAVVEYQAHRPKL
ncbi:MAG TPA: YigZ family protein [Methanocorpusculum sp.]|jgi:putative IMPACT (imprinted ancient) family translation regulator|nr:YigZ family protein [Methanocorpusculum parvum]MBQ1179487.1 YigZ family protein [Methanocorpusculum sp.]MBR5814812.1 YigZ family protein [Methanocorpusculaceae archaeon]MBE6515132.1 YigZ family protein [Methanocorpusculum parvum]MBQ2771266.1 YigZ family protein [Methanocorpusculum sp.]